MALDNSTDDTTLPSVLKKILAANPVPDAGPAPVLNTTPAMTGTMPRLPDAAAPIATPQTSVPRNELGAPLVRLNELGAPLPANQDAASTPAAPSDRDFLNSNAQNDAGELNRLKTTGSGISQIQSTPLRTLARIGDTAARILLPKAEQYIGGGEGNHERLVNLAQGNVSADLADQQKNAQTNLLDAQPQLKQAALDLQSQRLDATMQHQQDTTDIAKEKAEGVLRGQGYKHDPTGKIVALDYDEMSPQQQGTLDAKKAQADYQSARAEYEKSRNDPNSFTGQVALAKMKHAETMESIAYGKMGLDAKRLDIMAANSGMRRETLNANYHGTDADGVTPLDGAPQIMGSDGQTHTVGIRLAGNAIKQNNTVASFNDLSGSIQHTRQALQALEAEGGSLSDPRLIAAASDPHSVIGKMVNGKLIMGGLSPAAITALNAVRQTHEQAGILRKTTGGTASENGAQRILDTVPTFGDSNPVAYSKLDEAQNVLNRLSPGQTGVKGGLSVSGRGASGVQAFTDGGVTYHIPAAQVSEFKKDHPNAR